MRFNFFVFICLLGLTACSSPQQQRGIASETTTSEPDPTTDDSSAVYVEMDINPAVQKMVVTRGGKVIYTFPISSGRGTFDIPTNFHIDPSCSNTEEGTFTKMGDLREHHYSNTWLTMNEKTKKYEDGALMGHSIFFNGGIAIHAAGTAPASAALGPKTPDQISTGSGGCVRLFPWDAKALFDEVAGCKTYEKATPEKPLKPVCFEREVSLQSTRTGPDGKVNAPRCVPGQHEKRARCVEYDSKPNCNRSDRPGWCTDPKQFTVKQARKLTVTVKDSRSKAEKDAEKAKCIADRNTFNQRKAECLGDKIGINPHDNSRTYTDAITKIKSNEATRWSQLNYQCNEQLYNEAAAKVAASGGPATPAAAAAAATGNSAESPPLPPPQPRKKFRDTGFGKFINGIFGGGRKTKSE